jgi:hypothetical protein
MNPFTVTVFQNQFLPARGRDVHAVVTPPGCWPGWSTW